MVLLQTYSTKLISNKINAANFSLKLILGVSSLTNRKEENFNLYADTSRLCGKGPTQAAPSRGQPLDPSLAKRSNRGSDSPLLSPQPWPAR